MNQHPSDGARLSSGRGRSRPGRHRRLRAPHHDRRRRLPGPPLSGAPCHHASRLVHVCDVFDALRTHRPYRDAWPLQKTTDYIEERAGLEFDPDLVKKFLAMLSKWEPRIAVLTREDEVIPRAVA